MSIRLFVALDLPEPALRALAAFRDAAADPVVWRPLDASSFHVTLAFLGHRDEADVARCVEALSAVPAAAPPPLAIGRALLLTRVLTVGLEDPTGGLGRLQRAIRRSGRDDSREHERERARARRGAREAPAAAPWLIGRGPSASSAGA